MTKIVMQKHDSQPNPQPTLKAGGVSLSPQIITSILTAFSDVLPPPYGQNNWGNAPSVTSITMYASALGEIVVADSYKQNLVEGNVVGVLTQAMGFNREKHKDAAFEQTCITTLLHLALYESTATMIKDDAGLLATLEGLQEEGMSSAVRRKAKEALFVLTGYHKDEAQAGQTREDHTATTTGSKHIMLSYCWDEQEAVLRVARELQNRGYNLW